LRKSNSDDWLDTNINSLSQGTICKKYIENVIHLAFFYLEPMIWWSLEQMYVIAFFFFLANL